MANKDHRDWRRGVRPGPNSDGADYSQITANKEQRVCRPDYSPRHRASFVLDNVRSCVSAPSGAGGISGAHQYRRRPRVVRDGIPIRSSGDRELRRGLIGPTELIGCDEDCLWRSRAATPNGTYWSAWRLIGAWSPGDEKITGSKGKGRLVPALRRPFAQCGPAFV